MVRLTDCLKGLNLHRNSVVRLTDCLRGLNLHRNSVVRLTDCLRGLNLHRNSVVRLTDCPAMTIAVYMDPATHSHRLQSVISTGFKKGSGC